MAKNDTNEVRLEKIAALKKARRLLEQRREIFVCHALARVGRDHLKLRRTTNQLASYVRVSLGGNITLEGWQRGKRIQCSYDSTDRVAWLNWMIESLQEELA